MKFFHSFYNFPAYAGFLQEKKRGLKIFLYILLMAAITYVFTFLIPAQELTSQLFGIDRQFIDDHVPEFTVQGGRFAIAEPVLYENPDGLMVIIAVSEENITADDAWLLMRYYQQALIISSHTIVIKQANGSINEMPLSQLPDFDRAGLYAFVPFLRIAAAMVYAFVFLCYIAAFYAGTFVCTGIASFIARGARLYLPFPCLFALTAYARTAPVIIKTLIMFAFGGLTDSLYFYFFVNWILFYGLFCIYAWKALTAVRDGLTNAENNHGNEGTV
jgi:hypothetical protein